MRDLAVAFLFFYLVYVTIRRPFIGVAAWAWIAFAYPAGWAWGFSTNFRINFTIAILTYVGYFFYREKPKFKLDNISLLILIFWVIALISSAFSESLLINFVWDKYQEFSKILLFYLAIILILKKKVHIDTLIWSVVLSISSYAAMESFKFIVSFGNHMIAGYDGHVLGDRNDLAVAINMAIPLIIYLINQTKMRALKVGLILLLLLNILAIIGTYSRGGFVGLVVLGGYFYIKSNRKLLLTLILTITIGALISSTPSAWNERMSTVSTASSLDSSFIGRLWAWKISVKIANENVFGNGFYASQDLIAWHRYRTTIDDFGPIYTPPVPEGQVPKAAHSIYFQVLGDMGYGGLIIFLLILAALFRRLQRITKKAKQYQMDWCGQLTSMLSVSLVGFLITGANVSMAYFDFIYLLIGISYVLEYRVIDNKVSKKTDSEVTA